MTVNLLRVRKEADLSPDSLVWQSSCDAVFWVGAVESARNAGARHARQQGANVAIHAVVIFEVLQAQCSQFVRPLNYSLSPRW